MINCDGQCIIDKQTTKSKLNWNTSNKPFARRRTQRSKKKNDILMQSKHYNKILHTFLDFFMYELSIWYYLLVLFITTIALIIVFFFLFFIFALLNSTTTIIWYNIFVWFLLCSQTFWNAKCRSCNLQRISLHRFYDRFLITSILWSKSANETKGCKRSLHIKTEEKKNIIKKRKN